MANSAVVGVLRALLVADTAEFDAALKRASDTAKDWSKDLNKLGKQATSVGETLTKGLTLPLVAIGAGASKLAIDFESSFAGVRKTVSATEPEFAKLAQQFRDLAKQIPINVNEINKIGEAAGALGIPKEAIASFSKTMAELGITTNLTSDQAANAIARIQNIFGAAGKDTDRLASTLVALGNAGASTESEIVNMAQRLAGAGHTIGLTQAQVLGFASALASVGISAEEGGSAMSRVFLRINEAAQTGGEKLAGFAKVAGLSAADFKKAFETDAAGAIQKFLVGLHDISERGGNVSGTITGLVGKNIQLTDTLLRLSGNTGLVAEQLGIANVEWQKNTALTDEAKKRYETTASQLTLLWNRLKDVGITLGNALLPSLKLVSDALGGLIPTLEGLVKWFTSLPTPVQAFAFGLAAVLAAAGPVLVIVGQMSLGLGGLVGAFAKGGLAANVFGKALGLLQSPWTWAITAAGLLAYELYGLATAETDLEKSLHENAGAFRKQTDDVDNALDTYDAYKNLTDLTKDETEALEDATIRLAHASGTTSVEAFKAEMEQSNDLTEALREQQTEKRALMALAADEARAALIEAQSRLADLQDRQKETLKKGRTVMEPSGEYGAVTERTATPKENLAAYAEAEAAIKKQTAAVEEARAKLESYTGVVSRDIALKGQQTSASRKHTGAVEDESKADEKAAKAAARHTEEIIKQGRALSTAGVADKIADLNLQVFEAEKAGGVAKENWQKLTEQIDDFVAHGYPVSLLLQQWRLDHINLVAAMMPVTTKTKELITLTKDLAPEVFRLGDQYAGLSAKYQAFSNKIGGALDSPAYKLAIEKGLQISPHTITAWQDAARLMKDEFVGPHGVIPEIGSMLADTLAVGLTHAKTFKDAFVDLWRGIQRELTKILGDLLNLFINKFLKGIIGSMLGEQGAWSQAFSGIVGGATKGATGAAAKGVAGKAVGWGISGGGTAAGAGAGGAGGAGGAAGSGGAIAGMGASTAIGMIGGPAAGAAVGYFVGYKSGSKTKGIAAGAATGAAVGSVAGPWGTAVGAGVGALAGWYGAVKAGKKVNDIRDAFSASQGSIEQIEARLKDLGREDLFKPFAFGERNIGAIKEAIGNIQEVFAKADAEAQKLAADQKTWTDKLASSFTSLSSAADAYGTTLPANIRATIAPLLESKDLTAEMRAQLTGMAADPSWQQMQSRAQALGIDLNSLGPKFSDARLGDIALGYVKDLTMFSDAGADMSGVLSGMSDELSQLYQDAEKTGTQLPKSVQPYMEQLAKMGLLLDANGNKVETLNDEAFKEVEDKGLKDVVSVLDKIALLLEQGLPKAAEKAASGMADAFSRHTIDVPYRYTQQGGSPTGPDSPSPELGLWGGTHGQYVDWGAGTNVTLHGKERVVPEGEALRLNAPIHITVVSTLDGRTVARNQIKHIPRELGLAGV